MSFEQALLARARPYMIAARARALVAAEASKGCCPDICADPVALEPPFEPLLIGNIMPAGAAPAARTIEVAPTRADPVRLQAWISPQQEWTWNRCELFLKELSLTAHRVGWEIAGNRDRILCQILCHPADLPVVRAAFAGQFERCELSRLEDDSLARVPHDAWAYAVFVNLHPLPPYSRLLTAPDELERPPCAALMSVVARLPPPAMALYQVIFAPVSPDHDWHHNVRTLWDLDFATRLIGGLASTHRFAQQAPSGDLRQMALDLEVKAHNDKPFFAAALRIGLIDGFDRKARYLRALGAVAGLIQHGGRPLSQLTQADYGRSLPQEAVRRMFTRGLAHRHGFLVNSWELASLVHPPPPEIVARHDDMVDTLETLPAAEALGTGTSIGTCNYAGEERPVCIPPDQWTTHVHLIGQPGQGKSTLMESMLLQIAAGGPGAAVLDPHGRLVQRLLYLLPEDRLAQSIDAPIDRAAEAFECPPTPATSQEQFLGAVARFLQNLYRNGLPGARTLSPAQARDEAVAFLDDAHRGTYANGYYGALVDAIDPSQSGLDLVLVLARVADLLKARQRQRYVRWVAARHIDSADWQTRCAMAALLMDRCGTAVPPELRTCPPAQLADHVYDLLLAHLASNTFHRQPSAGSILPPS